MATRWKMLSSVLSLRKWQSFLPTRLIRQKVFSCRRLLGTYYLVAIDGTGMLSYHQRHCEHCLTRRLANGQTLYYHHVLEAKLVSTDGFALDGFALDGFALDGFALSLMTEFVENSDPDADKQDCELKAFYRLAKRLKVRFPRLSICLLMDGLFAGGPVFRLCAENST